MSTSQTEEEWISLSEAANLLGIHPTTVRLWANRNELPLRRTNGGHRRFRRADIEARLRQDNEPRSDPPAQMLIQSVLERVQFTFTDTDGTLNTLPWYEHFDENARQAYRLLGRRVLELLLCAVTNSMHQDELRREAIQLGTEYGSIINTLHMPVANAVRAFLYFRTLIDESMLQLTDIRGSRDHRDIPWIESLNQMQTITNEILLALIEATQYK